MNQVHNPARESASIAFYIQESLRETDAFASVKKIDR